MRATASNNGIRINGFPPKDLLASLVAKLAQAPRDLLQTARVASLRKEIRAGKIPDYENDWAAFAYLYFSANFVKTHSALKHFITPEVQKRNFRILDLGCGSGSSSAAAIVALESWINKSKCDVEIVGVESNAKQAALYDDVFRPWARQFKKIKTTLCEQNVFSFLDSEDGQWDLIIVSYLFAELSELEKSKLRLALQTKCPQGATEVVVIDTCAENSKCAAEFLSTGQRLFLTPPPRALDLSIFSPLNVGVFPMYGKFCAVKAPQVLLQYFDAWERHDTWLLRSLFWGDALYVINDRTILHGWSEIEAYWKKNALEQTDVNWQILDVNASESLVSAKWSATFHRRDKGFLYSLEGTMHLDVRRGQIAKLSETYSKHLVPI